MLAPHLPLRHLQAGSDFIVISTRADRLGCRGAAQQALLLCSNEAGFEHGGLARTIRTSEHNNVSWCIVRSNERKRQAINAAKILDRDFSNRKCFARSHSLLPSWIK
jgi:hypothetical protein